MEIFWGGILKGDEKWTEIFIDESEHGQLKSKKYQRKFPLESENTR